LPALADAAVAGGGDSAGTTNVSGTASKGILYPGTINIYALDANGNKGALLKGGIATDINGKYSAPLGSYDGAIVVEASGTYTDEATAASLIIPAATPLHAGVDRVNWSADNSRVIAVTPLTEIAWRKANASGSKPTAANIGAANKLVGDLFKISDILSTEPVRPDNADMSAATPDAQAYTLALATLSQMASTAAGATAAAKLETVLARMELEVEGAETGNSMSPTAISDFTTAMGAMTLSTDFPAAKDQLAMMGKKSQLITLTTNGTLPTGKTIYALQGSIALPANVSVRVDSTGRALPYAFALAGVASGKGAAPVANYLGPQRQLDFSVQINPATAGIGIGDFATMTFEVAAGATVTAADFSMMAGTFAAKDANGADITGITVTFK
jgi:hypothetical protein